MRIFAALVFAGAFGQLESQIDIEWSDPVVVAEYQFGQFVNPRIAVNESDEVVIVWSIEGDATSWVQASFLQADTFSSPTIIHQAVVGIQGGFDYHPTIATADSDFFISYKQGPLQGDIVSRKSTDGGQIWEDEVWVDEFLFGDYAERPFVAIDGEGHPHVAMIRTVGNDLDIGAICSVNFGDSYTAFIPADNNITGQFASDPILVIDENKHVVAWIQWDTDDHYRLYAALSTNNGATFNDPVIMSDLGEMALELALEKPGGWIVGGDIYLCWESLDDEQIFCTKADLGDMMAEQAIAPESIMAAQSKPAVSGDEGLWAAFWQDDRSGMMNIYGVLGTEGLANLNHNQPFGTGGDTERLLPSIHYLNNKLHMTYVEAATLNIMYIQGEVSIINSLNSLEPVKPIIYPNPVNEIIKISAQWEGNYDVEIFNSAGILVKKIASTNLKKIVVSDLAEGYYILNTNGNGAVISISFCIVR